MRKRVGAAVLIAFFGLIEIAAGQQPTDPSVRILFGEPRVTYCDVGGHIVFALIHITVTFQNQGDESMILSREFGQIDQITVKDSSGAPVYSPDRAYYGTPHPPLGDTPDDRRFEIIKPNSSADRDVVISIPVSTDAAHRHGSMPLPGRYRISARAGTWPYFADPEAATKMRAVWARYGTLIVAPIDIKDARVQLFPPQNVPACSNY